MKHVRQVHRVSEIAEQPFQIGFASNRDRPMDRFSRPLVTGYDFDGLASMPDFGEPEPVRSKNDGRIESQFVPQDGTGCFGGRSALEYSRRGRRCGYLYWFAIQPD